jgi:hypothetical protein
MYLLALWRIIHKPSLVFRAAYLARDQRREVAIILHALHEIRTTGLTPAPHIFPAKDGGTVATLADRNCKSGSFCNPNRAI